MGLKSEAIIERVRARLAKVDPAGARQVGGVFQFKITQGGAVVKQWVLNLDDLTVSEGTHPSPRATLTVEDEIMDEIAGGKLTTTEAVQQDKLIIDGDLEHAVKLKPFIAEL